MNTLPSSTMTLNHKAVLPSLRSLAFYTIVTAMAVTGSHAYSGAVQIADAPMASGSSVLIKPNVMFILDDSGSMGWTHMPDHVRSQTTKYGYKAAQCNSVYYNPNVTYTPPVKADGSSYPNSTFTDAWYNGFNTAEGKVNLSTKFKAYDDTTSWGNGDDAQQAAYYYKYTGAQPALSYEYNADGSVKTTTTFYKECNSSIGSTPGKNVFTKITVPAAEQQNFANWYSYYRIRIYMMKTAAGFAFKNLTSPENYRIGFTTHSYTGVDSSNSEFLKLDDFCAQSPGCTQRTSFYTKLYGASPSGGTPLRAALSKVGRMYAGQLLTGADDPMQYSCQQNFAILSTDGFWNGSAGYKIDGTSAIGNQDGTAPTPMKDALNKSDTLADVAMYYYETDLRTTACTGALGNDVCENNVPGTGKDTNNKQHMTTFTLGLGVDGSLKYAENYESGGSADYTALEQGTKNWPDPTDAEDLHRVDDLWHAAVNGHGTYYSAKTPDTLASGLSKALAGVSARTGAAAAAATSNLEPVAGDNYAYVGQYTTVKWDGEIQAREIDLTSGTLSETPVWSAQAKLDALATSDGRTIYAVTGGVMKAFTSTNMGAEIAAHYFDAGTTNPNGQLSQYPLLSATDQAQATPQSIINYIRGLSEKEDQSGNTYRLFRDREHVLGDIVNSQPVYAKKPPFKYSDDGYADFANDKATRQSAVYVGSNDGMLHAFNGDMGDEMWAFIPSAVLPYLYKLADKNYANNHRYYVDGPITIGDVCFTPPCTKTTWKTILVGGLNKGGRSYYALDITNPASPSLLWEFTTSSDSDIGYSFGNPVITKRNGTWVVIFTSGYNNTGPGDGKGRLYVVNAKTGAKLSEIITDNAETDPAKSGIGKINNWVDDTFLDNTTQYVYGGDLEGNIWRFDIVAGTATQLTTLGKVAGAGAQPVTTKPELGEVKSAGVSYKVVYVGTGRYLGVDDISNTDLQSLYAIKDDLTNTYGNFRTEPDVVEQTMSGNDTTRTITANEVKWDKAPGWFVDFDLSERERVTVDPKLQLGALAVATNIPDPNSCNIGGYSWLYFFDYKTGSYVTTSEGDVLGEKVGNALVVGLNVIRLPNGKTVTIATTSDNKHPVFENPAAPPGDTAKRVYWRELVQ